MIDTCAWTGHWGSCALPGAPTEVVDMVADVGAAQVWLSPLDGVWAHNAHAANAVVYTAASADARVRPVPVIDPTLATWHEELQRAVEADAPVVRWLPSYSGFEIAGASEAAAAIGAVGRRLWVQVRLEDPRRHHPRAVVPDAVPGEVVELARRHPDMDVIVGGATWKQILDLAPAILDLPRCWADVSQADGMDSLLRLVDAGLGERLLYGSHAPFFLPLAGVARILLDLDDETSSRLLHDNAAALLAGV